MKTSNSIRKDLIKDIFSINKREEFEKLALEIFHFQYLNNIVYREYIKSLRVKAHDIRDLAQIPFLPIEFFKTHRIIHNKFNEEIIFLSSGTTGLEQSRHYVVDKKVYLKSFTKCFTYFYGNISDYCILALLPGYLERKGSSLIYMVHHLMQLSNHPENGFYLNEYEQLAKKILTLKQGNQKYLLIGVTYALLDFAKHYKIDLGNGIVMETGGMKGKRKELTKEETHQILCNSFNLSSIHSEYGMTELLSQAYSNGAGVFSTPKWMSVMIRDTYDPFSYIENGKSGGINIIDLANLYSCAFIETKDLGRKKENGQFEVLGRFDNSNIRGCNLLVN